MNIAWVYMYVMTVCQILRQTSPVVTWFFRSWY